ncbi:U4 snRNA binding protein [Aureococcus anophagefferens]|nr:U4 snRNA binding protein [Aureococcus anophagefferens]
MGGGASKKKDAEWELEYEGHSKAVLCVAFSPCGARVATGSLDGTALVFNAKSGGNQLTLEGHGDGVACVAFAPGGGSARDGQPRSDRAALGRDDGLLSSSLDSSVRMWDAAKGDEEFKLKHRSGVAGAAFSECETRVLSCCRDKSARLWCLESGKEETKLSGHRKAVNGCAFSAEYVATAGDDEVAKLWLPRNDLLKEFEED